MTSRHSIRPSKLLLSLAMFLCACSHPSNQPTTSSPASSLMDPYARFEFAVYMLPTPIKNPSTVLRDELRQKYPDLILVEKFPDNPTALLVSANKQTDLQKTYPPPSGERLKWEGKGLTDEQGLALKSSREAFVLDFESPATRVWTGLRTANLLVEDIARETGGLIWDEETREVFSPDAWHQTRLAKWAGDIPAIQTQTVIHAYQEGEFVRAISLGMGKAGLPDVVVENFVWSQQRQVGHLINLFSQSMAEGAAFNVPGPYTLKLQALRNDDVREPQAKTLKPGATGVAYLTLKRGAPDEGDPDNRLIVLAPDRYSGSDYHARLDGMISCFFGATDAATGVKHDEVLLEASRKAREDLPALKKAFNAGLEPSESILLKAPFKTTDGSNEWMWVEVSRWQEGRITGVLDNDPFNVPDLHAGQTVAINEEDVFDYIRHYPDGHTEGNTTGPILEKMQHQDIPQPIASTMKPLFACGPFR